MSEQAVVRKGLESLLVWEKAMHLATRIYKEVLPGLPKEEKWAMAVQLRRAAASVPANIAEGYGRFYYQEGVRFCYIARGSLEEVRTFLALAKELNYLDGSLHTSLSEDIQELRKILGGYVAYLKKNKPGQYEPGSTLSTKEDSAIYSVSTADWEDDVPDPCSLITDLEIS
ncbi:MAG: four helix bundle protein [Anaerolineales bacterium]|nr:four helix bundle protein [Anaerolineales bacterium]